MSENIKLSLNLINEHSCNDLRIKLYIDTTCFYDEIVLPGSHHVSHEFDLSEGEHVFKIEFNGKTDHHTIIDSEGQITEDVLIKISDIEIDEILLDQLASQLAVYNHNYNGHGEFINDKFFGPLGCNGTVTLNFTSPFYLWLLENM